MSLTVALAVLGGLILAAIIAHGAWNARRANPRRAEPGFGDNRDSRMEPSMGGEGEGASP